MPRAATWVVLLMVFGTVAEATRISGAPPDSEVTAELSTTAIEVASGVDDAGIRGNCRGVNVDNAIQRLVDAAAISDLDTVATLFEYVVSNFGAIQVQARESLRLLNGSPLAGQLLMRLPVLSCVDMGRLGDTAPVVEEEKKGEEKKYGSPLVGEGWKTVHVWVGRSSYGNFSQWNSQHGQDMFVAEIFNGKRHGFFVDLAAGDAIHWSNTVSLEQRFSWSGICIEARDDRVWGLSHRRCHQINALVGSVTGDEYVFSHSGPWGPDSAGIVGPGFANTELQPRSKGKTMPTIAVDQLLSDFKFPAVIDYMSLDVEGAEDMILSLFAFHALTLTASPRLRQHSLTTDCALGRY